MKTKDWTGNSKSIYTTLGASNHVAEEREADDFYATDPRAAELLCELEPLSETIWECAAGQGHLAKVLAENGHTVISTDLVDRGYGYSDIDFLKCSGEYDVDIVTNPPYKYASEFVEKAMELVTCGHKVCMFLKLQFLEGKARKALFAKYPPKAIYVSSSRILCAKNGDFDGFANKGCSAVAYSWMVWQKGYTGDTVLKWFN
ncbi:MAG: hypothetical protein RR365_09020 [Bacteroides sp.]